MGTFNIGGCGCCGVVGCCPGSIPDVIEASWTGTTTFAFPPSIPFTYFTDGFDSWWVSPCYSNGSGCWTFLLIQCGEQGFQVGTSLTTDVGVEERFVNLGACCSQLVSDELDLTNIGASSEANCESEITGPGVVDPGCGTGTITITITNMTSALPSVIYGHVITNSSSFAFPSSIPFTYDSTLHGWFSPCYGDGEGNYAQLAYACGVTDTTSTSYICQYGFSSYLNYQAATSVSWGPFHAVFASYEIQLAWSGSDCSGTPSESFYGYVTITFETTAGPHKGPFPPQSDIKPPGLFKRAMKFIVALTRHTLDNFQKVTVDQQRIRLNICGDCEYFKKPNSCRICGCGLALKASWKSEKCPKGKW